jgi:hypothetical protein
MARSLNSICRARDEARYVSRTWSNTPSAPDVPWEPVYSAPVESPDDMISVCRFNPMTFSGEGSMEMLRSEYEANKDLIQTELRAVRKGKL